MFSFEIHVASGLSARMWPSLLDTWAQFTSVRCRRQCCSGGWGWFTMLHFGWSTESPQRQHWWYYYMYNETIKCSQTSVWPSMCHYTLGIDHYINLSWYDDNIWSLLIQLYSDFCNVLGKSNSHEVSLGVLYLGNCTECNFQLWWLDFVNF